MAIWGLFTWGDPQPIEVYRNERELISVQQCETDSAQLGYNYYCKRIYQSTEEQL